MENQVPQAQAPPVQPAPSPVFVPGQAPDVEMGERRQRKRGDVEMSDKRASTRLLEAEAKKAADKALKKERDQEAKRVAEQKRQESRRKNYEKDQAKKEKNKQKEEAEKAVKKEKETNRHENFKRALESHAGPLLKDVYHEARRELLLRKIPKVVEKKRGRSSSSSKSASQSMDSEEKHKLLDTIMEKLVHDKINKQIEHLERGKKKLEEDLSEHHEKLRECLKYLNKDSKAIINDKYTETIKTLKDQYDEGIKKLRSLRNLALSGIKYKQYGQKQEETSSGLAEGMNNMFTDAAAPAAPVAPAPPDTQLPQAGGRRRQGAGGCGCNKR